MKDKEITIIVSAYMRPNALNRTLKSIYKQSYKHWQVLIIGDCCDNEYLNNVDDSNSKVRIINLPIRCGNQYGPNSVGIHLAKTDYLAFVNHDDLLLEDHLSIAIETIEKQSADIFLGKAAFCDARYQKVLYQKKKRLSFFETNQPDKIWRVFHGPNWFFEPSSSWLVSTKLAKAVGYWRTPDSINSTPVMDWLQRSAILGAKFCHSNQVSTLKINLHNLNSHTGLLYADECSLSNEVGKLNNKNAKLIRHNIEDDLIEAKRLGLKSRYHDYLTTMAMEDKNIKSTFNRYLKMGYYNNDIPPEEIHKTHNALKMLELRTGEKMRVFIKPEALIAQLDL